MSGALKEQEVWVLVAAANKRIEQAEAEVAALQAENADLEMDVRRIAQGAKNEELAARLVSQDQVIADLRAHVAALVQALEDAAAAVRGVGELHIWQQKLTEWDELIHAPDLAELVKP